MNTQEADRQIRALAATDRNAAYALMARLYLRGLTSHANSVVKNAEEANDIAAEALLRAMTEPALFEGDFCVRAWLHRVVFNRSLNALRDRARRERSLLRNASAVVPSAATEIGRQRRANELVSMFDRLMLMLTAEHAVIIRLRYYESLGYQEIADRLGIPIGTVMSRLSRAHKQLQRYARSEGVHETLRSFL